MKAVDIVELLISKKILIQSVNNELKLKAAKGALTPDIVQLIKQNKELLIEYLVDKSEASVDKKEIPLTKVKRTKEGVYPLSFAQKRLWIIDQMQQGSANYNIPSAIVIEGDFEYATAVSALHRLVERHEILRTTYFADEQEQPMQKIHPSFDYAIKKYDLTDLSAHAQEVEVQKRAEQDANAIFDLSKDGILRVTWLQLAPRKFVLLFNMHHIGSDGWSMNLLMQEFIKLYQYLSSGQSNQLIEPSYQYLDYAQWQSQYLQGDILKQQQAYWKSKLHDAPVVHNLPLDRARVENDSQPGRIHYSQLAKNATDAVLKVAKNHQVTPFMLVHSIFSLLLSRYSMTKDVIVGTPIANRMKSELETIIGYFANTLILRTNCQHEDLRSYLQDVKNTHQQAQQYQDIPFEALVDFLQVPRSPMHAPLYQIMLSMDTNESSDIRLDGLTISQLEVTDVQAKHDITLEVLLTEKGLDFSWTYNTNLFDQSTIEKMAEHLNHLFIEVANKPNCKLSELQMLSKQDEQLFISSFNDTQADYDYHKLLHELFINSVKENDQSVAIIDQEGSVTYKELFAAAYQLSEELNSYNLQSEELVAVLHPKGRWQVISCLAILMAGAAYLPLSVSWPTARCHSVVTRGQCRIVLCDRALHSLADIEADDAFTVLYANNYVKPMDDVTYQKALACFEYKQTPDQLAYVIFTSGSTGTPKGVAIEHKMAVNTILDINQRFSVNEKDRVLAVSELSFDLSVYDVFGLLAVGGSIVFPHQELAQTPKHWLDLVNEHNISIWDTVPASAGLLTDEFELYSTKSNSSLKTIMMSGDWIAPSLPERLHRIFPKADVYSLGGATEGSIWSIFYPITASTSHLKSVPYGKPLSNQAFYIVDESLQLVPQGTIGELCIAGAGIARCYYRDETLTDQKFVTHSRLGIRLYRTGDLGRYLKDGNIEFIGRVDEQVKIRGYRVELGDIEFQVKSFVEVNSCAVIAREDAPGIKQLVAYYQLNTAIDNVKAFEQEVRIAIAQKLPEYMVPSAFVNIDKWPLTANGKVDKKSLPAPQLHDLQDEYEAPSNSIEQQLVRIWSDLLSIDSNELSVTANFFMLGGDSILSIQMVSRAAKAGLKFTVQNLFATQTIRKLAQVVNQEVTLEIPQHPVVGAIKLNAIQQEFFTDLTDWKHFNQSVLLKVKKELNIVDLAAVLQQLLTRHDALRTTFNLENDHWTAQQLELAEIRSNLMLEEVEWTSGDPQELTQHANKIQESLDPEIGLTMKLVLFKGQGESRILLVIHHLVVDGVSWRIILDDLHILYHQIEEKLPLKLEPKTSSFKDWSEFLYQHAKSSALNQERVYWENIVSQDTYQFEKKSHIEKETYQERLVSFSLDEKTTQSLLSNCAEQYHAKVNELLLTSLILAMSRMSNDNVFAIELESHGRESLDSQLDISQTVGWFTCMYPFIVNVDTEQSLASLVRQVKEQYRALPSNGLGYGILKYLAAEKLSHTSAPELLFNYLGQLDQAIQKDSVFEVAQESMGHETSLNRQSRHGVTITGYVEQGALGFTISYNASLYEDSIMIELKDWFESALVALTTNTENNLKDAVSVTDFELATIDSEAFLQWNKIYNIQDLYPATGMQQGMLFHSMLEAGSYVTQIQFALQGIDAEVFHQAWDELVKRYDVLRTCFVGLEEGRLHQLVIQDATMPWQQVSLLDLTSLEQSQALQKHLIEDKLIGFEPSLAPLSRVTLFATSEDEFTVVWSHHHALLDGWCLPILFSDLLQIYYALKANDKAILAPVYPYRDYASWLSMQDYSKAQDYWKGYISEINAVTPLPLAGKSFTAIKHNKVLTSIDFSVEETQALVQLAKDNATTINIVIQACWALLLSRYSGEEIVVFGATSSGRPAELNHVEDMVGLFINSLPVKTLVNEQLTFKEWLPKIHLDQIEREKYNYVPLMEIQSYAEVEGSLFNSLLVFENYPADEAIGQKVKHAGIALKDMEYFEGTNYDLTITAFVENLLSINLESNHSIYSKEELDKLAALFKDTLLQMPHMAEQPLSHCSLIKSTEEELLLRLANGKKQHLDEHITVIDLFERCVNHYPESIALEFGQRHMTYRELHEYVNALSEQIIAAVGYGNHLIALQAERSLEMVIAIFAIMKSGKAYVPIEPSLPVERIDYILQDTQCTLLLTNQEAIAARLNDSVQVMDLSSLTTQVNSPSVSVNVMDNQCKPNDLAYVIYTSGSTGQPKGVMLEHKALLNRIDWMQNAYSLTPEDKVLQKTPYSFDVSVWEFIWPLLQGATLVVAEPEGHKDPEYLFQIMQQRKISVLHFVPSMLSAYLDSQQGIFPDSVRLVFCSGEALDKSDVLLLHEKSPHVQVHNLYGPTEAAIDVSYFDCRDVALYPQTPIGKPIQNIELLILDKYNRLCPLGVEGELCIAGDGLARGYLNKPELTLEKFIEHPLREGERLYKTGDRARVWSDGNIDYLGRIDDQVKIRGLRIELGEIEHQLIAFTEVDSATVIVRNDLGANDHLVAYIVKSATVDINDDDLVKQLRHELQEKLPEYMIPAFIVFIDEVPLTTSGKTNRKLLPRPTITSQQSKYIAPQTEMEIKLHNLWCDFMDLEKNTLSCDQSYFSLGGDSIGATRLVSKIKQELNIELPLASIFEHRTIISLAKWLDCNSSNISMQKIKKIERTEADDEDFETGIF